MKIRIYPPPGDPEEISRVAAKLLAAADHPSQIQIDTSDRFSFLVDSQVAAKAELDVEPATEQKEKKDTPASETPKKRSAKKGAS